MDPRRTLGTRKFLVLIIFYPPSLGPTKCCSKKCLIPPKMAQKSLVKIGLDIDDMDKWTNVVRTNVAWTNANLIVRIC